MAAPIDREVAPVPEMTVSTTDAYAGMDPRLQRFVARQRQGLLEAPTVSSAHDEVAVIAKVTDVTAWEALSEVQMGGVFGEPAADGTQIVTGRIPLARIEYVRQQRYVTSLKATQSLRPALDKTIAETGARTDLLPQGQRTAGGAGVVVGIIDFGFDIAHHNFRHPDGSTRLLALWQQAGPSTPTSPFGYGKTFTPAQINAALLQPDPYSALGYGPVPDQRLPNPGTHGTHVADIAAGNGRGSGISGMAPNADIVFVDVATSDIPRQGPQVVGTSFGDSTRLLEAVLYIFQQAGTRPCVINISLGTNGGPHDGTTLVEEGIDRLVRAAPNRAVVIAASNAFADGIHAAGTVPPGGQADLLWDVRLGDTTQNELEVWYRGPDRFAMELLAPGGRSLGRIEPGHNGNVQRQGQVVLFVANRLGEPNNQDNTIGVFLESGLPSGRWTVRLHGVTVQDGTYHAWIERDDPNPSNFAPPHDNTHTIGSISCGHETIVVGSYDAHKATVPLSFFSSAGPTRDGRQKPEVSAPGHALFAAHSRTGTGVTRKSGTSMAAPAVTGLVALLLAQAQAQGLALTSQQIRDLLTTTARHHPPDAAGWDDRYGHGRVSATAAVAAVMALPPPPPPVLAPRPPARRRPSRRNPR